MKAWKLLRLRKDGSLGSLFINARRRLPVGEWMEAEAIATEKFAFRPGWHVMPKKKAPHLSLKGRTWRRVEVKGVTELKRPAAQGGTWWLAKHMKVLP